MRLGLFNGLEMVALAALLGVGGLAATATTASAHYVTTRCDDDDDRCGAVICDDDGDDCEPAPAYRSWDRGERRPRAHWVCDDDGERCHWAYGSGYVARPYFGFDFGWHD